MGSWSENCIINHKAEWLLISRAVICSCLLISKYFAIERKMDCGGIGSHLPKTLFDLLMLVFVDYHQFLNRFCLAGSSYACFSVNGYFLWYGTSSCSFYIIFNFKVWADVLFLAFALYSLSPLLRWLKLPSSCAPICIFRHLLNPSNLNSTGWTGEYSASIATFITGCRFTIRYRNWRRPMCVVIVGQHCESSPELCDENSPCAFRGQICVVRANLYGEGKVVWWGQSCVVRANLCGEGKFVWWGQICVVRANLCGEGKVVWWGQIYVVRANLCGEGKLVWWGKVVWWEQSCVVRAGRADSPSRLCADGAF